MTSHIVGVALLLINFSLTDGGWKTLAIDKINNATIFNLFFFSREWNDTEIHVGLSNSEGTVLPTCK